MKMQITFITVLAAFSLLGVTTTVIAAEQKPRLTGKNGEKSDNSSSCKFSCDGTWGIIR